MINITTKMSYPKGKDKNHAYKLYLKNLKKRINAVDTKGKKASVHFTCEKDIISADCGGNKELVKKIEKVIYG